jgi:hypothetical protein
MQELGRIGETVSEVKERLSSVEATLAHFIRTVDRMAQIMADVGKPNWGLLVSVAALTVTLITLIGSLAFQPYANRIQQLEERANRQGEAITKLLKPR